MGLAERTPPTAEEYAAYRERFSNWGRWGADDELGTLNLVTDDVRRGAAALVQHGRTVSLARPLDTHAGPANPYPAHHFVRGRGHRAGCSTTWAASCTGSPRPTSTRSAT